MKKEKQPEFKIGDVLRVVMPVMAVNLKEPAEGEKKLQIEEVLLVGDEGLIVINAEYVKKSNEYLYQVLTENSLETKMFSIPEEQLTLF
jgi:ribosomal protein L21